MRSRSERFAAEPRAPRPAARRAVQREAGAAGRHPDWRLYLNGPEDYRLLQRIQGVGPRRAEILMAAFGSVSAFLWSTPDEVCRQTGGRIRAGFAETLQQRARALRLATAYAPLAAALERAEAGEAARPEGFVRTVALRLRRWIADAAWRAEVSPG